MAETKHYIEKNELTFERIFDAPQKLVFEAFTNEDMISQWWGPTPEWTVPVSKMDLKVGGKWHYMMKGPDDGSQYANMEAWGIATFIEITPFSRLVWKDAFSDASGAINEDFPQAEITFEFIDQDGKTLLKSTGVYESEEELQKVVQMGMVEGFSGSFENLDVLLNKEQQNSIESNHSTIVRTFDAPRDLIFNAFTKSDFISTWWGPKGFVCPHAKIDPEKGGKYHLAMQHKEYGTIWSAGEYLEFDAPAHLLLRDYFSNENGDLVSPSVYGMAEDFPQEMRIEITFEEVDGKTKVTLTHGDFDDEQVIKDTSVGWNESFDKLEESLASEMAKG